MRLSLASRAVACFSGTLLAAVCLGQDTANPWPATALLEPSALAQALQSAKPPVVVCVAFPVLYRNKHIAHAVYAGPGSKPEGIESLKKAVAALPKDADLVIYCGCCPMVRCPNIRPAYHALKQMGFTHVRVLNVPTDMHTDWFSKNYPSEGTGSSEPANN
jgi:hypothetical protein